MYPTPSAQAAEAIRKHPPNRISNRFRNIAPPRPGDTPSPTTLIGPGDVSVKWHEGQHFSIGYWTKGQLARFALILLSLWLPTKWANQRKRSQSANPFIKSPRKPLE